jgi:hypothetical protein
MRLSKKHKFILYILYQFLREANKRFKDKPLEMSVSKIVFIDALKKTKIAEKSERALYRNLEVLEKKKLIKYENRFLKPTKRGLKMFLSMHKDLFPYIHALDIIKKEASTMSRKAQTYFK